MSIFVIILFFFFKQKTAYEMRISDWSSDVCSSDLLKRGATVFSPTPRRKSPTRVRPWPPPRHASRPLKAAASARRARRCVLRSYHTGPANRSEEHTSELQSLMRISYAVFCLQKNKNKKTKNKNSNNTERPKTTSLQAT